MSSKLQGLAEDKDPALGEFLRFLARDIQGGRRPAAQRSPVQSSSGDSGWSESTSTLSSSA